MFGLKASTTRESSPCLLKNVGVSDFNKQHLRLVSYAVEFNQMVEELAAKEPDASDWKRVDALFSRVCLFVSTHFREEEEQMEKFGYPGYPGHKAQHDKFVASLAKIQSQINDRNVKFKGKLSTLLWDWLYNHINEVDVQYRDFFADKGLK
ncbi:MAG: hemerythrin family protein [Gammaproteobacteria bacterium]|nr:hemerythrin family protein [Gammaproteobacteria bacterium]